MESSTSASIFSASTSIRCIFSRIDWKAASIHSCARSAPTYPWVSLPTCSRSQSLAIFILRVLILRMSTRPMSSGTPISNSRSKRPKRRRAGSITLGRLVAAITTTFEVGLIPSMSVSSWETMRRSTSPPALSLLGAMESISSMKMIAGAFFSASSKALRRLDSDSPASLDMISGPFSKKKYAPVSAATAFAIIVLPEPGGPYISTPRGGGMPTERKIWGWRRGSSTSSLICASCLLHPPISSYPISLRRSSSSRPSAAPSQRISVSSPTMQYSAASSPSVLMSVTLNSTVRIPPLAMKVSPIFRGRAWPLK
mmetsp:Transcript_28922/g.62308  ORF Transcript_28922/g.62308 Transcript_28922/m.62308 type:complete len:312 (-) Transcript_28922:714-1649(-)